MTKFEMPTGAELQAALEDSFGKPSRQAGCTKHFACRCDECKSLYVAVMAARKQASRSVVKLFVSTAKSKRIFKAMPPPVTAPKQPKSCPGQLGLFN